MRIHILINTLQVALLIAMTAALIVALWTSQSPAHTFLATVSWNG